MLKVAKDNRQHYVRVVLEERDDTIYAHLTGDQGSGILLSMVQADGLAIIPEEVDRLPAGSVVRVMHLSW